MTYHYIVYTRDGRYFKLDEFDKVEQRGKLTERMESGKTIKRNIYFYNNQIVAVEWIEESES